MDTNSLFEGVLKEIQKHLGFELKNPVENLTEEIFKNYGEGIDKNRLRNAVQKSFPDLGLGTSFFRKENDKD